METHMTTASAIQNGTIGAHKSRNADVIYWTTTGIVCAVMIYSAINFNLSKPLGPMKDAFKHLGLPDYFRIELTVAKVLGVLAVLIPQVPRKAKEFAYFGFGLTFISAGIAHFAIGDPIFFVIDPLIFFGVLIVSYSYFEKRTSSIDVAPRPAPDR
jgi:hypothetical protein